jgi:hypothetical protein
MPPELKAACDAMPKEHLTFIVTAYGNPRSKYELGNDFAKWVREAGLPDHCRLHGLKKAAVRRRAEAGNTAHELMAFSGHKTLQINVAGAASHVGPERIVLKQVVTSQCHRRPCFHHASTARRAWKQLPDAPDKRLHRQ